MVPKALLQLDPNTVPQESARKISTYRGRDEEKSPPADLPKTRQMRSWGHLSLGNNIKRRTRRKSVKVGKLVGKGELTTVAGPGFPAGEGGLKKPLHRTGCKRETGRKFRRKPFSEKIRNEGIEKGP